MVQKHFPHSCHTLRRFKPTFLERKVPCWICATNNTKLTIEYKNQESIFNNRIYLKNLFIVTNDINHSIILDTPFIDMITPYKIIHENIISKINGSKLIFPFLKKPKTRNLNLIKACFIYTHYINALIHGKQSHLMHLKKDAIL